MVIVRLADDFVCGFEHEGDAQRFLVDLRERFSKFNLELRPDKTRLIEFGRNAAWARAARGLDKPWTFDCLGFLHFCGKMKTGRFLLRRKIIAKRMRAKLAEVKKELRRRRRHPIPVQGQWLGSVVRGHLAYYAVPGNADAVAAFRTQVTRHWLKSLRRRSQRQCSVYAACVRLLQQGKKINYQGASGNDDFNKYHNVFSGFQMVGFDSKLNNVQRAFVTPQQLASVVAKEG